MATTRGDGTGEELRPSEQAVAEPEKTGNLVPSFPASDSSKPAPEPDAAVKAAKAAKQKKRKRRKKKQASEFNQLGLQPRLLRMQLAAKYMSMSISTLRRLIQADEIRVVRVGEKTCPWLLDIVELNAWVERNSKKLGE